MALDLTAFDAALKEYYTKEAVTSMAYADRPLLALLKKDTKAGGDKFPILVIYGDGQNRSATFATAQAGTSDAALARFELTRNHDYYIGKIDNETLLASEDDAGAFLKAAKLQVDTAINSLSNSLERALFGDGTGVIGKLASTSAVGTVGDLSDIEDIVNWEKGGSVSSIDLVTGQNRGSLTVSAVNRSEGKVTFSAALSSISVSASANTNNNAFVYAGDYNSKLKGLLAWLPPDASLIGTSFFGVDRTADTDRLAGVRIPSGSNGSVVETIINTARRLGRDQASPDVIFLSYDKFARAEKELQGNVQYTDLKGTNGIGFKSLSVMGPKGPIAIVPATHCPNAYGFMLTMSTWKLYSLKDAPHIQEHEGGRWLSVYNADQKEVRVAYYAQLGCSKPGHNAVITW